MNFGFSFSVSIGPHQYQTSSSLPLLQLPQEISPSPDESFKKIVKLMCDKPDGFLQQLRAEISDMSNVNLFHKLKNSETDFNLLFHASKEDCKEAVEFLLEKGADPTLVNNRGTCVLHLMAKRGQVEMAKKCYSKLPFGGVGGKKYCFINGGNNIGWTPLMAAAENNQQHFVKWLLANNASTNITMETGWTAMHAAAKNGNCEVLKLLLVNGGDKKIQAAHKHFGRNVTVEKVAKDKPTLQILQQF